MNIRFYICVLFIALSSYVLLFAGGSGYVGPDVLDFDTALEKVRGGELVKELTISGGDWADNCTSPEKYQYLVYFRDLEDLSIARCGIKVIPPEVFELKNLKYLDLSSNGLEEIPEEIGKLKNLKELFLQGNQISKLPESIGQLMNLEELNLDNNQLSTLPNSIVNLINIKDGIRLEDNNNLKITRLSTGTITNGNPKGLEENIIYLKENLRKAAVPIPPPRVYTVTATSGLSVRNKPKLKAKKIGSMPYKLKIAVYGESAKTETMDGITAPWMRITALANGQYMEGWAWGGYLKVYKYEKDYPRQFREMVNKTASKMEESNFTLDTRRVQFFIKNGVDINTQSKRGWTLLGIVADAGNIQDFRFLLANGASVFGAITVVRRKDIGFESKKAFLLTLQDYGYDFKANGKGLLEAVIISDCKGAFKEQNLDSELLDFVKDQLNIESVYEILDEGDIREINTYYC